MAEFSQRQLIGAGPARDPTYLVLPADLPEGIRVLAQEITAGLESPYEKAKAIERHLRDEYSYRLPPGGEGQSLPPEGRDPVDWFLSEHHEGGSGSFSSAFVLLARAAGVPADTALVELATSPDPTVRAAAAGLLGEIGGDLPFAALVHAWSADPVRDVRRAAMESLAGWDLEELIRVLLEHDNPLMRTAAAHALGVRGDARALDALLAALAADEEAGVRGAAATALGELGERDAAPALVEGLQSDESSEVREAAAEALGDLLDSEALHPLLMAREEDESVAVQSAAAGALNKFGSHRLVEALRNSDSVSTRAAAAQVLGERGNPSAIPPLIEALSDPSADVRAAAKSAAAMLGEITELENGSAILSHSKGVSLLPGATSQQSSGLPHVPVFEVTGAARTDFLRTAVGDHYLNGGWVAEDPTQWRYLSGDPFPPIGRPGEPTIRPAESHSEQISLSPAGQLLRVPAGVMPTSFLLAEVSVSGTYRPQSATFFSDTPTPSLSWESTVSDYSGSQLNRAAASRVYRHRELADGMPRRIGELAVEITANQPAPYAKAKAIEQYLRTEYLYRLADPSGSGQPPSGHDPVDWFLFESRQGTCGNFSSAFVALARAVGLPARVVSGWAIAPMAGMQTVYADQAHQRAEIAFEGLGWVAFEPTPAESAPSRAAQYAAAAESKAAQESVETDSLVEGLTSGDADTQEKAREGLEQLGATVTEMENGASLVTKDGVAIGLATGTTSAQAKEPSTTPVFFVTGAENTGYLRTSVGDVYQNGVWQQLDPVTIGYEPPGSVPHLVRDEIDRPGGELASLPEWRVDPGLLARYETRPGITLTDTIHVRAAPDLGRIPAGAVPTSLSLDRVGGRGGFSPFSSTFQLAKSGDGYQWVSQVPHFSNAQLHSAQLAQDPTYTQLPDDIPERIGRLALEITQGHSSPYAKAKAIETYLNTHYAYSYSTGSANEPPPPEHDPADWFLFEYQEGTCGVFSTAFAVLARSVGIPARVVSGWSITPMAERQVVRLNQAHQWAEVAFEGLGWVSFEPTASGPPSRTAPRVDQGSSDQNQGSTGPDPQPVIVFETATAITEWPARVNRQTEFTVGGTVQTLSGRPVNGTEVEVFVNETKEHGGIKVGSAVTIDGQFRARVQIPSSMELGPYQLIAHAIENDRYLGSWSDPDFAVYSESGFELTGPIEIPVDVQAVFRGRLTEDTGGGVAGQQLQITVDDADVSSTKTGPAGDFSFGSIFTEPGAHWVEFEFEGREFLVGNSVRLELTATMPTQLDVNAPATVPVGEEFQITGVLQNIRGEPVEGEVSVTVGSGPSQSFQTGAAGEFETTLSFVESGVYLIAAEYMAEHPVLPSANSVRVVARHVTALTIDGPREIENGKGATFSGDVVSTTLSAIGPLRLLIADGEGNELATVSTETDGSFEYQEDSLDKTGPNVLTAVFAGEEFLTASSAAVAYLVLAPTKLSIDGPGLVRVGESPRWNGRLLQADGQPVPNASLQVGNGEGQVVLTGSDGGFSLDGGLEAAEAPSGSEIEVEVSIPVRFDGTDHLAAALAELRYTIGLPRVVVEPTESVARGEGLTLRGTALIGWDQARRGCRDRHRPRDSGGIERSRRLHPSLPGGRRRPARKKRAGGGCAGHRCGYGGVHRGEVRLSFDRDSRGRRQAGPRGDAAYVPAGRHRPGNTSSDGALQPRG